MSRARASRWAVLLAAAVAALAAFLWKGRSGAGAVEIVVVDAFARRPIANAFIRVCRSGASGPCVERNVAGGTARFAVSADLDYTLAAEARDYAPAEMTFAGKQERVVVQLVPRRIPQPAVPTNGSGKVLDASDRPIPEAAVRLLGFAIGDLRVVAGAVPVEVYATATTAPDGSWKMTWNELPGGAFLALSIVADGYLPAISRINGPSELQGRTDRLTSAGVPLGGVVVQLASRAPIAKATVFCSTAGPNQRPEDEDYTALLETGKDGRWKTKARSGSAVRCVAARSGFLARDYLVTLGPEGRSDLSFELEPAHGQLVGRVVESKSKRPIPGTSVEVVTEAGEQTALTGADGAFQLGPIAMAGRLAVRASTKAGDTATFFEVEGQQRQNGGVFNVLRQPGRVNMEIVLERGSYLCGLVTDVAGKPIGGAQIAATSEVGVFPSVVRKVGTDQAGQYCAYVRAEVRYTMSVEALGYSPAFREKVWVGREGSNQDFQLQEGRWISGHVVSKSLNRPLPGAVVQAHAMDDPERPNSFPAVVTADEGGAYLLGPVAAGSYKLYAKRSGSKAAPIVRDVFVAPGADKTGVDLPAVGEGTVHGRVKDRSGELPRSMIVEYVGGAGVSEQTPVALQAGGLYELDIDEGNYQLKAWLAGHGKAGPKTVNVVEGEPAEVDWEFGAGYTLSGTVLKASTFNAPVAWANVGVHKLNHWPPESGRDGYQPITNELLAGSLQTDGYGKFKLAGLEAGDYLVKASSASAAPATKQIALHADADVTLELADGGHLRIRTLDAKGWPVQNAGCLVQKMPLMDQTYYLDSGKNGECQILRMEPGQYLVKGQFRAPPNLEVVEQTATVSAGGWTVVEIVSKNEAPLLADGADASGRSFRAQEGSQTALPEVTAPPQDRPPPGLVAAASNPNPAVIINVTLQPRDKPLPPPPPDPNAIVSGTREPPRTGR